MKMSGGGVGVEQSVFFLYRRRTISRGGVCIFFYVKVVMERKGEGGI